MLGTAMVYILFAVAATPFIYYLLALYSSARLFSAVEVAGRNSEEDVQSADDVVDLGKKPRACGRSSNMERNAVRRSGR